MNPIPLEECVPCIRPHFSVRGDHLYFLISRRPTRSLSSDDLDLFGKIDGVKTVSELAASVPSCTERIREWHNAEILELIPPRLREGTSPHIVVVEPHMDDAILSVGGRLLNLQGKARVTILGVVRHSNFTSYWDLRRDFLDVGTVTSLRIRESELAARLIGAEYRCLDWTDGPLRLFPAERWSFEKMEEIVPVVYSYKEVPPDPEAVSEVREMLRRELESLAPDEVWFPIGLSTHLDHRIVRRACISLFEEASGALSKASACLYEDLPYGNLALGLRIRNSIETRGTVLHRCTEDITDVFERKLRAVSVYASQFKLGYMEPQLRSAAGRGDHAAEGRLEEICYRAEGRMSLPPESWMSPNRETLEAMRPKLRKIFPQREKVRHFMILVTPSGNLGRWREDCERVLETYRNAVIRLLVPAEMSWQLQEPVHERIRVVRIGKGILAWIPELLSAVFRKDAVKLVLWWGSGRKIRGWKGIAWKTAMSVSGTILFANSIGDCCLMLDEEKRHAGEAVAG